MRRVVALFVTGQTAIVIVESVNPVVAAGTLAVLVERASVDGHLLADVERGASAHQTLPCGD